MKICAITAHLLAALTLAASAGCSAAPLQGLAAGETPTPGNVSFNAGAGTPAVSSSNLPSELAALHPEAGSKACPRPHVGVDLSLTDAMRKDGSFDPSTVALTLNGTNVTLAAQVFQAMTYPASRASILYTPVSDLASGAHEAAITYPTAAGLTTYSWSFTVADIPCP